MSGLPISATPDTGILGAGAHYFPIRVYYEDTDAGGIVYHAHYLRFAERARTEFIRQLGWPHDRVQRECGGSWAVRRLAVEYHRPARLDDCLIVETRVVTVAGASISLRQTVWRGETALSDVTPQLALVAPDGRPRRLPEAVARSFQNLTVSS